MKLIIQIPCLNEEKTHFQRRWLNYLVIFPDVDMVEWLIIDDGSTDRTVEVSRQHGVDHIVSHTSEQRSGNGFPDWVECLPGVGRRHVIVNTDADNQYPGRFIPDLVRPILQHEADMVIGDRQTHTIPHFSPVKKRLQSFGSAVVRYVSQTDVPDAPSGFRALTRETALRINVMTSYTYTLETIIQVQEKEI